MKPVMLQTTKPADLIWLLTETRGLERERGAGESSRIEFGAQHAILVLDEETRQSVPEELKGNLILTIYERKGLEFDDVLIYNFCKSSKCANDWRVVTGYLNSVIEIQKEAEKEVLNARISSGVKQNKLNRDEEAPAANAALLFPTRTRPRPLHFDSQKQKLLACELKQFYTAVTRARDRVWIFDEAADRRAPLFEYFRALELVEEVQDTQNAEELKAFLQSYSTADSESTPFEWRQRALEFYQRKLFKLAAQCFEKADDPQMKEICLTHLLFQELLKNRSSLSARRFEEQMLEIVIRYLELENIPSATKCLHSLKSYELLAGIYERIKMVVIYRLCYSLLLLHLLLLIDLMLLLCIYICVSICMSQYSSSH